MVNYHPIESPLSHRHLVVQWLACIQFTRWDSRIGTMFHELDFHVNSEKHKNKIYFNKLTHQQLTESDKNDLNNS